MLSEIVPSYLTGSVYSFLVDSYCSEQEARMTAMKTAGNNAEDVLKALKTQYNGITPSMSRRGNPYDNALAENFFSILKTECIYRAKLQTYEEARLLIGEYIHFYNNQRIQLKTKLTPQEMRSQFVA